MTGAERPRLEKQSVELKNEVRQRPRKFEGYADKALGVALVWVNVSRRMIQRLQTRVEGKDKLRKLSLPKHRQTKAFAKSEKHDSSHEHVQIPKNESMKSCASKKKHKVIVQEAKKKL